MKKQKITTIFQCFFMAAIACIAVIFVIKYSFEIKTIKNNQIETTKTSSVNQSTNEKPSDKESFDTSGGINQDIEVESPNDDDAFISINNIPLNERVYIINNKKYYNSDLMKPCEYYNSSIVYNEPKYLGVAYPQIVIDYLVAVGRYESDTEYLESLYSGYKSIFDENFFITNTLIDTTVLSKEEVKNMNAFYNSILSKEFDIEYAVLMKTTCTIQSFGTTSDETLKHESEDEYFISYFYNNKWYIDYLYSDYYFFN